MVSRLLDLKGIQRYDRQIEWHDLCAMLIIVFVSAQRRFKAAFEAYKEREMPNVRAEVCIDLLYHFLPVSQTSPFSAPRVEAPTVPGIPALVILYV